MGGIEDRRELRYHFIGDDFPGAFLLGKTGKKFNGRPVDVSNRGLGLISNISLDAGMLIIMQIGNYTLHLEVMYCNPHLGIDGKFRAGLFSREAEGSLVQSFFDAGLGDSLTDQPISQMPVRLSA